MAADTGTLHHLTEAARSVATSRHQTTAVLGLLACTALVSPAWAGVAAVGAIAMVAARPVLSRSASPFRQLVAMREAKPHSKPGPNGDPARSYLIGTDYKGNEIALSRREVEQGILVFGTTGSGKSENLIGILDGFLSQGSGCLFIDGKGDVSLHARLHRHAVHHGREDDFLVLNFMTGIASLSTDHTLSNTFNPYAHASVEDLHHLLMALVDPGGQLSAKERARCSTLAMTVARIGGWLGDTGQLWLHPGTLRDTFRFDRLFELYDASGRNGMPPEVRTDLAAYMASLEGYSDERGSRQATSVLQAHAEIEAPIAGPLGMLSDVYGHIFHTQCPEIDMRDVVSNDRIVTVMLPALEKSGDDLANLGRIVLAAMSPLASAASDGWRAKGRDPFPCFADEVGYYAIDGLWGMASRARESGVCWIFAAQDRPAMMRLNEVEAERIMNGVRTLIFMRTEEMADTVFLTRESSWVNLHAGREDPLTMRVDLHMFGAGDILVIRDGERIRGKCAYYDHLVPGRYDLRLNRLVPFEGALSNRKTGTAR